ncbi:MAG TPA: hypothetical protein VEK78_15430 [Gemmatimonadales bacterium]|nr:hypothetical protein [Gemmatimonadales bacterium]
MTDQVLALTAALADRYRLERELGRGGMATVYLAHDLKHDRPVALKVLHPELASALGPERFQREIMLVPARTARGASSSRCRPGGKGEPRPPSPQRGEGVRG